MRVLLEEALNVYGSRGRSRSAAEELSEDEQRGSCTRYHASLMRNDGVCGRVALCVQTWKRADTFLTLTKEEEIKKDKRNRPGEL